MKRTFLSLSVKYLKMMTIKNIKSQVYREELKKMTRLRIRKRICIFFGVSRERERDSSLLDLP